MQRSPPPLRSRSARGFQSSPVPRDGCNHSHTLSFAFSLFVSILTRPEGRVQLSCAQTERYLARSFNPHPSRGTGATFRPSFRPSCLIVSILTRPEGRVQLVSVQWLWRFCLVSILTRPEGRVQRPPKITDRRIPMMFQSSPVPRDGCNPTSIMLAFGRIAFQSSPVPRDGCNQLGLNVNEEQFNVSILTRPEGRVQHICL